MRKSLPPLGWIRSFEAAARHGSFAGAAQELNLTPAAVSQQIRALEQHLGMALFQRLPRDVRLTDSARAWQPAVHRAIDELALSTASLFGNRAGKTVTLRATISFSVLCLAPAIAGARPHPSGRSSSSSIPPSGATTSSGRGSTWRSDMAMAAGPASTSSG